MEVRTLQAMEDDSAEVDIIISGVNALPGRVRHAQPVADQAGARGRRTQARSCSAFAEYICQVWTFCACLMM